MQYTVGMRKHAENKIQKLCACVRVCWALYESEFKDIRPIV
ncbi:MAG: hypothetical protein E7A27_12525 [Erysipelotrichaceae bacterium]|nr:hypothetical protein [Erysipelotrichaceae bacterium]